LSNSATGASNSPITRAFGPVGTKLRGVSQDTEENKKWRSIAPPPSFDLIG
jgi:hypothetical protein